MEEDTGTEDRLDDLVGPSSGVRSRVDELRERNRSKRERTLDKAIPEWDGEVVVRYGRISKKQLVKSARAGAKGDIDLLVAACREILVRDDRGQLEPASGYDGHPAPVRFDTRLRDMFELGDRNDTQEKIVRAMFRDGVAIAAHAKAIVDWQTGANLDSLSDEEVDRLLGEEDEPTEL